MRIRTRRVVATALFAVLPGLAAWAGIDDVKVVANWAGRVRGYEVTPPSEEINAYYSSLKSSTGSDIAVGDFDGDGDPDYASVIEDSGAMRIRIFDGSAVEEGEFWYSAGLTGWGDIVAGDFDNDDVTDVAAYADNRIRVWSPSTQVSGSGAMWYSGTPNTQRGGRGLSVGDFDGDGSLEIAGATNERLRLWEPATTPSGESADAVWYSDVLNAGTFGGTTVGRFRDVGLVGGLDKLQVAVSANDRLMVFEPYTQGAPVYFSAANYTGAFFALVTIDSDVLNPGQSGGDGDQIAFAFGNRVKVFDPYFPEPNGTQGNEYWISAVLSTDAGDMAVSDFDGDGVMEIIAAESGRLRAWEPATQGWEANEYWYSEPIVAGTATSLAVVPDPSVYLLVDLPASDVEVQFTARAATRFGLFGIAWSYDLEQSSDAGAGDWLAVPGFTGVPGDNNVVVFTNTAPQASTSYRARTRVQ